MKSLMYFSVSILCFALILLVGINLGMGQSSAARPPRVNAGEVAILSGVLPHGGTIPLPTYSDGTTATEVECHWIVSPHTFLYQFGGHVYCYSNGRTVFLVSEGGQNDPATFVNYMIIAVKDAGTSSQALAFQPATWGEIKTRYTEQK